MERKPMICGQCGAPLSGDRCEHCGTLFLDGARRLFLTDAGNHRRLVLELLQEMTEYFYAPGASDNSLRLSAAVSEVNSLEGRTLDPPVLLLVSESTAELIRWKDKIEENGGTAVLI